jgi:predicted Ser/Thr protein kinase
MRIAAASRGRARICRPPTGAKCGAPCSPASRHGRPLYSRAVLSVLASFLLLLASSATAGPPTWQGQYLRGIEAESQGDWAQAVEHFRHALQIQFRPRRGAPSDRLDPGGAYDPHFHIARCLTELGRFREAAKHLEFSSLAGVTPADDIAQLRTRIERGVDTRPGPSRPALANGVTVITAPSGARVFIDGRPRGLSPIENLPLFPGMHVVRVQAPGFRPWEQTVRAEAGQPLLVEATLIANATSRDLARPEPPPPSPATTPEAVAAIQPTPTRPVHLVDSFPSPTPTPEIASVATPLPATPTAEPPATPAPVPSPSPAGIKELLNRTAGHPQGRLLAGLVLLALLALAGIAGAIVWLRRRRQRLTPTAATVLATAPTRLGSPTKLGAFEVEGVLGRGGMATTYRARRTTDGCVVALKVPHEGYLADPTFVARFVREGRLGEQLHHPHIVRILTANQEDGRPFLAMELLPGRTLKQELRERRRLPLRRALEIAHDIAEALDYAHLKGIVHRDLKPENVMILPDGSVKVMDFGIAQLAGQPGLTTSNLFIGTPLYAAPEMVDPKTVDQRVDLYALGIILFEMLEGAAPFTADSPYRVLEMHLHDPLPRREDLAHPVPEPVWTVITRLCEKDRERRFANAEALLNELNRLLQTVPEAK